MMDFARTRMRCIYVCVIEGVSQTECDSSIIY